MLVEFLDGLRNVLEEEMAPDHEELCGCSHCAYYKGSINTLGAVFDGFANETLETIERRVTVERAFKRVIANRFPNDDASAIST